MNSDTNCEFVQYLLTRNSDPLFLSVNRWNDDHHWSRNFEKKKLPKIRCTISMYSLRMELDVFWPSTSRPAGLWNTHTHIYIHTRKSFIKVDVCHGPTRYKRITFSWRLPNARVSSAGLHFSAPPLYSVVSGHDPMVHGRFVVDVFLLSPRSTVIILKW